MTLLTFEVTGANLNHKFGIQLTRITEVLPVVKIQPVPELPELFSGIINYRGKIVPVVDLSRLIAGISTPHLMSSRIIILEKNIENHEKGWLGLIAGRVTGTITCNETDFQKIETFDAGLNFIEGTMLYQDSSIRNVSVEMLLKFLFKQELLDNNTF